MELVARLTYSFLTLTALQHADGSRDLSKRSQRVKRASEAKEVSEVGGVNTSNGTYLKQYDGFAFSATGCFTDVLKMF